jgi:hypothetical protein
MPAWLVWAQPASPVYWSFTQIYNGLYSRPFDLNLLICSFAAVAFSVVAGYLSLRWSK